MSNDCSMYSRTSSESPSNTTGTRTLQKNALRRNLSGSLHASDHMQSGRLRLTASGCRTQRTHQLAQTGSGASSVLRNMRIRPMHAALGMEKKRQEQGSSEDISSKPTISRCSRRTKGLLGTHNRVLRKPPMEHRQAGKGI